MENVAVPNPASALDNCQTKQAAQAALKKAAAFAKEKPLLSLAVAAGVGLLVGALARRS